MFADTLIEDEDLYRFLDEAAANIGAPLVRLTEGRTPFEVFRDERFLGNSLVDPCSRILKRELISQWKADHCDPRRTICIVGIGNHERHRFFGGRGKPGLYARKKAEGWEYRAPLCDEPYLATYEIAQWAEREGLTPPQLYDLGFKHNNCGGGCIKAGQSQWRLLLRTFPERYARWEREEQSMRNLLNQDVSILKDRRGGARKPLTLAAFRERCDDGQPCEVSNTTACNCFAGEDS